MTDWSIADRQATLTRSDARTRIANCRRGGAGVERSEAPTVSHGERPLYKPRTPRSIPSARTARFRRIKWAGDGGHARHLLRHALDPLGPRPVRARPGGAGRSRQPPLLLLLHRDLAAGILLRHRPAGAWRRSALFLVTVAVGRAWCGYACPQTVWTDLFHRRSSASSRATATPACSSTRRPGRSTSCGARARKHAVWLLIAVGDRRRLDLLFRRRADAAARLLDRRRRRSIAYITVGILTATTYVFGGLMREQVCTYMCPWPRIQGAMLDEHSLTVTYHAGAASRAAPHKKGAALGGPRRLHRLQRLRRRLPDGHRHPRRLAARMHHTARSASTPATTSWTRSAGRAA